VTNQQLIVIGVSLLAAFAFGPWIARVSQRKDKIHGGFPAKFFHLLGAMLFVSLVPGVLTGIILGFGFSVIVPALIIALLAFTCFVLHAAFESQPRKLALSRQVDRGWTEEDARKSGL
jgi:fatty acid desaturase